jgi:hypothetical protein
LLTAATMSVKLPSTLAAVWYQPAGEAKETPPQLRRTVSGERLMPISAPDVGPLVAHSPGADVGYTPPHPATRATPTGSAIATHRRNWWPTRTRRPYHHPSDIVRSPGSDREF